MKDTYCPKCQTHLILNDDIKGSKYIKCPSCSISFKNPHLIKNASIKIHISQKPFIPIFLALAIAITIIVLSNIEYQEPIKKGPIIIETVAESDRSIDITNKFIILYNELMGFKDKSDFHYYGFRVDYKYKEWQRRVQELRRSSYAKDFYREYGFPIGHLEMLGLEYALYEGEETSDAKYYKRIIREGLKQFKTSEPEQTDNYSTQYEVYSFSNKIKMRYKNGVYLIPIYVNGVPMEFIFDTGASSISISLAEVKLLVKQGKLKNNDILGESTFSDATGRISIGTIIILRQVQVGNKILYDVEASVVHNYKAPLLLGQSALARFGKISIDYDKHEITFEE